MEAALQVANGGAAITPALSRRLLLNMGRGADRVASDSRAAVPPRILLTPRELEVLRMIAKGLTTGEVSLQLAISSATVNSHLKNVYVKLQVHTRAHAVGCAISRGLI